MDFTIALCRLYSPACYSVHERREAALYILRCSKWASAERIRCAKRELKGDAERKLERLTPGRALEIIQIKRAATARRAARKQAAERADAAPQLARAA